MSVMSKREASEIAKSLLNLYETHGLSKGHFGHDKFGKRLSANDCEFGRGVSHCLRGALYKLGHSFTIQKYFGEHFAETKTVKNTNLGYEYEGGTFWDMVRFNNAESTTINDVRNALTELQST